MGDSYFCGATVMWVWKGINFVDGKGAWLWEKISIVMEKNYDNEENFCGSGENL